MYYNVSELTKFVFFSFSVSYCTVTIDSVISINVNNNLLANIQEDFSLQKKALLVYDL